MTDVITVVTAVLIGEGVETISTILNEGDDIVATIEEVTQEAEGNYSEGGPYRILIHVDHVPAPHVHTTVATTTFPEATDKPSVVETTFRDA